VAHADPVDGVHLDAQNTMAIGEAIAPVVREALAH
jgi:lysophospholipase L1-like esterase